MRRNDESVYIYIPKDSSAETVRVGGTDIVKGSAIVGLGDDTIWYEGNIYNAVNMQRYGDRLRNVADKAFSRSMSACTGGFDPREFHRIGTVSRDYVITLDNQIETAEAIEQWTTETPAEIVRENRTFLDTRAFNRGLRKKPRFVHACLTCKNANVKQLKQEAGGGRVFCNTLCQQQYYFAKLRISEGDEAGPPISDDDIIGIENKTTGRRFRLTRAQAMQLQTIADLLTDAGPDTVNDYILFSFDDYGFSVVVDFLKQNITADDINALSEDQFEAVVKSAFYFGANILNWKILLVLLFNKLASFFRYESGFGSDTENLRKLLRSYIKILPSVFLFAEFSFLQRVLKQLQRYLPAEYKMLNLDYDYEKLEKQNDIWSVIYLSARDNLFELQMIQKFYDFYPWPVEANRPIWSAAFTAAARNGQMRIVTYLMQDERVNPYINVPEAFSAAVAAKQDVVVENLITHPSITAKEKSDALINGMATISVDLAFACVQDDAFLRQEFDQQNALLTAAVENNRADIIELLIDEMVIENEKTEMEKRMNQLMQFAAERGFEDVVIFFLGLGCNASVIPERFKTPKIVQALRARYAGAQRSNTAAETEAKRIKLGQRIKF